MNNKILVSALSVLWAMVTSTNALAENIKTRWAAEVNEFNARPEYPRPQMVRRDWMNLNGLWDYSIAPSDIPEMGTPDGKILVPFCAESSLSGVCRRVGGENYLWYSRTVEAPAAWVGKKLLLHFDAVDYETAVYANGELLGVHRGGFTSFSFDVSAYLAAGPMNLTVRVWDPTDDTEYSIPYGKQNDVPSKIFYTPVTGIWQTVWLEAVSPKGHISDYNVVSDGGILTVSTLVEDALPTDRVKVEVLRPRIGYNPEKPGWWRKNRAIVAAGSDAVIKIRRPKFWNTSTPWLYGLRISLVRDGKVIDKINGYTALRTVSIKKDEVGVKRLALNEEIIFHLGPLDQGWWPDGLYTAPTAEAMLFDVEKTKELGFNMIRKHIKVEPARWYYDCDRLGMMVWQDMPSIGRFESHNDWAQGVDVYDAGKDFFKITDEKKQNFYREWTQIMDQLKKFQSIVMWIPFNEAWGQFDTKAVATYTKEYDPTRLVNAASGGNWVKGAGEILDSHHYPMPYVRVSDPEMVVVIGEYGGIGCPVEGHVWEIDRKWGYVQYDSKEKVTETYLTYQEDLLRMKQYDCVAAGVYTQTTDVEGEVNGFFTYDREVLKMDVDAVREANRKVIDAPVVCELPLVPTSKYHYRVVANDYSSYNPFIFLYTISNGGTILQVTDFGAKVVRLISAKEATMPTDLVAPNKNLPEDLVAQYDDGQSIVAALGSTQVKWKMCERSRSSVTFESPSGEVITYTISSEGELELSRYQKSDTE